MNTVTTQKRAAKGGEIGANGEFYAGGKFINTVEENSKSLKVAKKTTRKQEVAPYVWEVQPEGKISIFSRCLGLYHAAMRVRRLLNPRK